MQPNNLDLSLIVAMTPDRVIGRNNALLWRIGSDIKRFKRITLEAGTVVTGFNTAASIMARNGSLLPDRHHIVLTKNHPRLQTSSIDSVTSVEEALEAIRARGGKACVIGGEQIYKLFLQFVRTAHITTVHTSLKGDTHFPLLRPASWACRRSIPKYQLPDDEYPTSFEELRRITEEERD